MNTPGSITVDLLSDATFSCGEGTPGLVDIEIEHDEMTGLPRIGGKTLHGLIRDSWLSLEEAFPELRRAAARVYGPPGDVTETSILRIGDAVLGKEVQQWAAWATGRQRHALSPQELLAALTDIRYQTSEDRTTGAPAETTLRSVRVALRDLQFAAPLTWLDQPTGDDLRCLALAVLASRHGGLGHNRGRGRIRMSLDNDNDGTRILARGGAL